MNFLEKHLTEKIYELTTQKQELLKHKGFLYFDELIETKYTDKKINRINASVGVGAFSLYAKEEILPLGIYSLSGKTLLEIYKKLKNNEFYTDQKFKDGKYYKVRLKRW